MNKERHERLSEIADLLNDALDVLDEIRSEEQDAFDNIPEYLQNGPSGNSIEDAIAMMDSWEERIGHIVGVVSNYSNGSITTDQATLTEAKRVEPLPPAQVCSESNHSITIHPYKERSLVIRGNTRAISDQLKEFGARFNPALEGGAGWIISKKHEQRFRESFAKYI